MTQIHGLDISAYQGDPNYDTLKQNAQFIIIKSSEGNGFKDSKINRNQLEARRVGMGLGYYHFARPDLNNTPEAEAQWFINCIWPVQVGELLVLDFEVVYGDPVNWCKKFLDYLAQHLNGTKALIYLNRSQLQGYNWSPIIQAGYGLWVASYDNDPNQVNFDTKWPVVAMKQYTSHGLMNGVGGYIDLNTFFGDMVAFKKYGYKQPLPPPVDQIALDIKGQINGSLNDDGFKSWLLSYFQGKGATDIRNWFRKILGV